MAKRNLFQRLLGRKEETLTTGQAEIMRAALTRFGNSTWSGADYSTIVREGVKANGAVLACLSALMFGFIEPELKLWRKKAGGGKEEILKHPVLDLLKNPMEHLSEKQMFGLCLLNEAISGNSYLHKVRIGGRVIKLMPLSDLYLTPIPGGKKLVSKYVFKKDSGEPEDIDTEDIVHFQWMPDPIEPWLGLAPLRSAAREVDTDNEATRYTFALLKNDAVPRMVVTIPLEGGNLTEQEKEDFRKSWQARYGGTERGTPAILEGGAKMEKVALSLEEMAFDALRRVPEARIAGVLRVPAVVAGLNIGLEQMTYNNVEGMRLQFTEGTLVSLWKAFEDKLNSDLLPEFEQDPSVYLAFDMNTVAILVKAQLSKAEVIDNAVVHGYLQVNEARQALGYQPIEGQNVFLRPASLPQSESDPAQALSPTPTKPIEEDPKEEEETTPKTATAILQEKILPLIAKVNITDRDVANAIKVWDEAMPDYAGLLDALPVDMVNLTRKPKKPKTTEQSTEPKGE